MQVFIDSNIFLHYPVFDGVDWCQLCGSKTVSLIICMQVIKELDEKKSHGSLAKRAKKILKKIHDHVDTGQPLTVNSVSISLATHEPRNADFPPTLSPDSNDDRIIQSALLFAQIQDQPNVFVCTEDLGMKIKCRAHDLPTITPNDSLRLSDPDSNIIEENRRLTNELNRLRNRQPKLLVTASHLNEGETLNKNKIAFRSLKNPCAIDVEARIHSEKRDLYSLHMVNEDDPFGRFDSDAVDDSDIAINTLLLKAATRDSVNKIETYLSQYRDYLIKLNSYNSNLGKIIRFKITIDNSGNCPAEDVRIKLTFPPIFHAIACGNQALSDVLSGIPTPPERPSKDQSNIEHEHLRRYALNLRDGELLPKERTWFKIKGDMAEGYVAILSIPKLLHHREVEFGDFYLRFNAEITPRPFQIESTVSAGNLPDLLSNKVNLVLPQGL